MKISYYQWILLETDANNLRNVFKSDRFQNTGSDDDVVSVDIGHPMNLDQAHDTFETGGDIHSLADKVFGKDHIPMEIKTPATASSTDAHKLIQRVHKGPDGTGYNKIPSPKAFLQKKYGISMTEAALRMIAHGIHHHTVIKAFEDAGYMGKDSFRTTGLKNIRKTLQDVNDAGYKDGFPPMEFAAFRDTTDPEKSRQGLERLKEIHKEKMKSDPAYRARQAQSKARYNLKMKSQQES